MSAARASRTARRFTVAFAAAFALGAVAPCLGCRTVEEPALPAGWSAADAARPLSREDCIDLALRSVPNAAAWRARLDAARAALDQADKLPNPTLNVAWEDVGLPGGPSGVGPAQTTFELGYALEELFSRSSRRAAADHDLRAQRAELLAERGALAAEVLHAYDELLAARARVDVARGLESMATDVLDAARSFVRAGVAAPLTVQEAETDLVELRAERSKLEVAARESELALGFALGFDEPVDLDLSDPLTSDAQETPVEDRVVLLETAAAQRPEIEAARQRYAAQLERAKLSASAVRYLPVIGVGPRFTAGRTAGVATLDVSLPLFDTGAVELRAREAELLATATDLRSVVRGVANEVESARQRVLDASRTLEPDARDVRDRRRSLRESTERLFEAGEVPYDRLAPARRAELEAELALVDAELSVASARVDLEAALGTRCTPPAPPPESGASSDAKNDAP